MTDFSAVDHAHMARALRLAERGLFTTQPNPRVGCVIAKNDVVIAEGWHQRVGEPHAEVFALRDAGERARSATATSRSFCGRSPAYPIECTRKICAGSTAGFKSTKFLDPCQT